MSSAGVRMVVASRAPISSRPPASPSSPPTSAAPRVVRVVSLSSLPLNCDILVPGNDAEYSAGPLTVRGWARPETVEPLAASTFPRSGSRLAAGPPRIRRQPMGMADVVADRRRPTGPLNVTARAWDDTGATHPESPASLWNPRGYANDAWAHVTASEMTRDRTVSP